jgi:hypothetical protein
MPLEDMEIIYAVFAGSMISEGFGKIAAIIEYQFSLTIYLLDPTHAIYSTRGTVFLHRTF